MWLLNWYIYKECKNKKVFIWVAVNMKAKKKKPALKKIWQVHVHAPHLALVLEQQSVMLAPLQFNDFLLGI